MRTLGVIAALLSVSAPAAFGEPGAGHFGGRAKNFQRPGWLVVDGMFARVQAELPLDLLVGLNDSAGRLSVAARPGARAEPLLRNYRTSLVRLAGSDFVWKLSCAGRVWNDTKAAGTQHLLLTAVPESIRADEFVRLTRVEVTPQQQTVQAVTTGKDGEPSSIIVVFGRDFIEVAVGPFGNAPPAALVRSTDARRLKAERPVETRQYLSPVLRLLTRGDDPLSAGAGDVYRAFPDLPVDAAATTAVTALLPKLGHADPAVRQRATAALATLGRRGVQAALRVDAETLPPEAAERLESVIAAATRDARPADDLRRDPNFLLDCLRDEDPNVRAAAGPLVGK